jgi:HEAT repeat protein
MDRRSKCGIWLVVGTVWFFILAIALPHRLNLPPSSEADVLTSNVSASMPTHEPQAAQPKSDLLEAEVSDLGIFRGAVWHAGNPFAESAPDIARWAAVLDDATQDPQSRLRAALWISRMPSEEALSVLEQALPNLPVRVQAAIAEALGSNPAPKVRSLLSGLVDHPDETTARGAVRGLAATQDANAVALLAAVLRDGAKPESVRAEAASALGGVPLPEAYSILARAAFELGNDPLQEFILDGLGQRDFVETQAFFQAYVEDPATPAELRAAAFEALADSNGDPVPFLFEHINDPDPEIRAAVAWALSARDTPGGLGPELTRWLVTEPEAAVRRQIFLALENQSNPDLHPGCLAVLAERDPQVRLAGFNWLAGVIESCESAELRARYYGAAIPELRETALDAGMQADRMLASMALARLDTPAALDAIGEVLTQTRDDRVRQILLQRVQHWINSPTPNP